MKVLFADTSFYVAIFSPEDALHAKARAVAAAHQGGVITTEFVLVEVGNFFCRGKSRIVFKTMVENLRTAEDIEIIAASPDLFDKGFALFNSRSDKEWSLTDCISFVVMEQEGLREALTGDRHFAQAGFVAVFAE